MLVFLFGGHDTTGYTIEWIIIEVAKKEDVYDKIKREIDNLIPAEVHAISYSQANSLTYLDMVIKEGMRLRPVAGIAFPFYDHPGAFKSPIGMGVFRKLAYDVHVEDFVLPKGSTLHVPFFPLFRVGIKVFVKS